MDTERDSPVNCGKLFSSRIGHKYNVVYQDLIHGLDNVTARTRELRALTDIFRDVNLPDTDPDPIQPDEPNQDIKAILALIQGGSRSIFESSRMFYDTFSTLVSSPLDKMATSSSKRMKDLHENRTRDDTLLQHAQTTIVDMRKRVYSSMQALLAFVQSQHQQEMERRHPLCMHRGSDPTSPESNHHSSGTQQLPMLSVIKRVRRHPTFVQLKRALVNNVRSYTLWIDKLRRFKAITHVSHGDTMDALESIESNRIAGALSALRVVMVLLQQFSIDIHHQIDAISQLLQKVDKRRSLESLVEKWNATYGFSPPASPVLRSPVRGGDPLPPLLRTPKSGKPPATQQQEDDADATSLGSSGASSEEDDSNDIEGESSISLENLQWIIPLQIPPILSQYVYNTISFRVCPAMSKSNQSPAPVASMELSHIINYLMTFYSSIDFNTHKSTEEPTIYQGPALQALYASKLGAPEAITSASQRSALPSSFDIRLDLAVDGYRNGDKTGIIMGDGHLTTPYDQPSHRIVLRYLHRDTAMSQFYSYCTTTDDIQVVDSIINAFGLHCPMITSFPQLKTIHRLYSRLCFHCQQTCYELFHCPSSTPTQVRSQLNNLSTTASTHPEKDNTLFCIMCQQTFEALSVMRQSQPPAYHSPTSPGQRKREYQSYHHRSYHLDGDSIQSDYDNWISKLRVAQAQAVAMRRRVYQSQSSFGMRLDQQLTHVVPSVPLLSHLPSINLSSQPQAHVPHVEAYSPPNQPFAGHYANYEQNALPSQYKHQHPLALNSRPYLQHQFSPFLAANNHPTFPYPQVYPYFSQPSPPFSLQSPGQFSGSNASWDSPQKQGVALGVSTTTAMALHPSGETSSREPLPHASVFAYPRDHPQAAQSRCEHPNGALHSHNHAHPFDPEIPPLPNLPSVSISFATASTEPSDTTPLQSADSPSPPSNGAAHALSAIHKPSGTPTKPAASPIPVPFVSAVGGMGTAQHTPFPYNSPLSPSGKPLGSTTDGMSPAKAPLSSGGNRRGYQTSPFRPNPTPISPEISINQCHTPPTSGRSACRYTTTATPSPHHHHQPETSPYNGFVLDKAPFADLTCSAVPNHSRAPNDSPQFTTGFGPSCASTLRDSQTEPSLDCGMSHATSSTGSQDQDLTSAVMRRIMGSGGPNQESAKHLAMPRHNAIHHPSGVPTYNSPFSPEISKKTVTPPPQNNRTPITAIDKREDPDSHRDLSPGIYADAHSDDTVEFDTAIVGPPQLAAFQQVLDQLKAKHPQGLKQSHAHHYFGPPGSYLPYAHLLTSRMQNRQHAAAIHYLNGMFHSQAMSQAAVPVPGPQIEQDPTQNQFQAHHAQRTMSSPPPRPQLHADHVAQSVDPSLLDSAQYYGQTNVFLAHISQIYQHRQAAAFQGQTPVVASQSPTVSVSTSTSSFGSAVHTTGQNASLFSQPPTTATTPASCQCQPPGHSCQHQRCRNRHTPRRAHTPDDVGSSPEHPSASQTRSNTPFTMSSSRYTRPLQSARQSFTLRDLPSLCITPQIHTTHPLGLLISPPISIADSYDSSSTFEHSSITLTSYQHVRFANTMYEHYQSSPATSFHTTVTAAATVMTSTSTGTGTTTTTTTTAAKTTRMETPTQGRPSGARPSPSQSISQHVTEIHVSIGPTPLDAVSRPPQAGNVAQHIHLQQHSLQLQGGVGHVSPPPLVQRHQDLNSAYISSESSSYRHPTRTCNIDSHQRPFSGTSSHSQSLQTSVESLYSCVYPVTSPLRGIEPMFATQHLASSRVDSMDDSQPPLSRHQIGAHRSPIGPIRQEQPDDIILRTSSTSLDSSLLFFYRGRSPDADKSHAQHTHHATSNRELFSYHHRKQRQPYALKSSLKLVIEDEESFAPRDRTDRQSGQRHAAMVLTSVSTSNPSHFDEVISISSQSDAVEFPSPSASHRRSATHSFATESLHASLSPDPQLAHVDRPQSSSPPDHHARRPTRGSLSPSHEYQTGPAGHFTAHSGQPNPAGSPLMDVGIDQPRSSSESTTGGAYSNESSEEMDLDQKQQLCDQLDALLKQCSLMVGSTSSLLGADVVGLSAGSFETTQPSPQPQHTTSGPQPSGSDVSNPLEQLNNHVDCLTHHNMPHPLLPSYPSDDMPTQHAQTVYAQLLATHSGSTPIGPLHRHHELQSTFLNEAYSLLGQIEDLQKVIVTSQVPEIQPPAPTPVPDGVYGGLMEQPGSMLMMMPSANHVLPQSLPVQFQFHLQHLSQLLHLQNTMSAGNPLLQLQLQQLIPQVLSAIQSSTQPAPEPRYGAADVPSFETELQAMGTLHHPLHQLHVRSPHRSQAYHTHTRVDLPMSMSPKMASYLPLTQQQQGVRVGSPSFNALLSPVSSLGHRPFTEHHPSQQHLPFSLYNTIPGVLPLVQALPQSHHPMSAVSQHHNTLIHGPRQGYPLPEANPLNLFAMAGSHTQPQNNLFAPTISFGMHSPTMHSDGMSSDRPQQHTATQLTNTISISKIQRNAQMFQNIQPNSQVSPSTTTNDQKQSYRAVNASDHHQAEPAHTIGLQAPLTNGNPVHPLPLTIIRDSQTLLELDREMMLPILQQHQAQRLHTHAGQGGRASPPLTMISNDVSKKDSIFGSTCTESLSMVYLQSSPIVSHPSQDDHAHAPSLDRDGLNTSIPDVKSRQLKPLTRRKSIPNPFYEQMDGGLTTPVADGPLAGSNSSNGDADAAVHPDVNQSAQVYHQHRGAPGIAPFTATEHAERPRLVLGNSVHGPTVCPVPSIPFQSSLPFIQVPDEEDEDDCYFVTQVEQHHVPTPIVVHSSQWNSPQELQPSSLPVASALLSMSHHVDTTRPRQHHSGGGDGVASVDDDDDIPLTCLPAVTPGEPISQQHLKVNHPDPAHTTDPIAQPLHKPAAAPGFPTSVRHHPPLPGLPKPTPPTLPRLRTDSSSMSRKSSLLSSERADSPARLPILPPTHNQAGADATATNRVQCHKDAPHKINLDEIPCVPPATFPKRG